MRRDGAAKKSQTKISKKCELVASALFSGIRREVNHRQAIERTDNGMERQYPESRRRNDAGGSGRAPKGTTTNKETNHANKPQPPLPPASSIFRNRRRGGSPQRHKSPEQQRRNPPVTPKAYNDTKSGRLRFCEFCGQEKLYCHIEENQKFFIIFFFFFFF